ncbi:MAG: tripartite tricarboxylate transporter substrate binding protein [Betaproteobacteria bacterium]|nr:MAG: tripartite tricarboxylate transporter substrate binding protein [Betaproteobacteria bacterium]
MRWALCAALVFCTGAAAQPYPTHPVKLIVPFPPGSTPDIVGRTLGAKLQEALGQPMVVENRTGAGGNIGTEAVAKAPADGYTLLISINGPIATNKYLYKSLPYDPDKDLAPISLLASAPQMLVVAPALGVENFGAFIGYARAQPGRISYASVGSGSASHLTMELLKGEAKIDLVHVPYRGFPPAVTDMLAGNIQAMFTIIPGVLPHVRAGKMKALAVTALKRSPLAPEVPSVAELGLPQLESLAWIGLLAPAATPREVLERLSAETMRRMQAADVRELLGKQGFDVVAGTPAQFQGWIRSESAKWARVIKASGATAD